MLEPSLNSRKIEAISWQCITDDLASTVNKVFGSLPLLIFYIFLLLSLLSYFAGHVYIQNTQIQNKQFPWPFRYCFFSLSLSLSHLLPFSTSILYLRNNYIFIKKATSPFLFSLFRNFISLSATFAPKTGNCPLLLLFLTPLIIFFSPHSSLLVKKQPLFEMSTEGISVDEIVKEMYDEALESVSQLEYRMETTQKDRHLLSRLEFSCMIWTLRTR